MKRTLLTVSIVLLLAACTPSGEKQVATPGSPAAPPTSEAPGPVVEAPPAIDPSAAAAAAEQVVNDTIESNLGHHVRYQAVIRDLQAAVAAGDAAKVAALAHYPLSVEIGGKQTLLSNEQEFVARYPQIMTPDISKAIVDTRYADLFVNYKGVMFGKGEAWLGGFCTDEACNDVKVKLVTLQHGPD